MSGHRLSAYSKKNVYGNELSFPQTFLVYMIILSVQDRTCFSWDRPV